MIEITSVKKRQENSLELTRVDGSIVSDSASFKASCEDAFTIILYPVNGNSAPIYKASFRDLVVNDGGSDATFTSAADAVYALNRFIGNFKTSGGSRNTPIFYHSDEKDIDDFIAKDPGLSQLKPGMYVVLNGVNPALIYLIVGNDPSLQSNYALVSTDSVSWDNIEGKPSSTPGDIDYTVENTYTKEEVDSLLSQYVKAESGEWAIAHNLLPDTVVKYARYTKIGYWVQCKAKLVITTQSASNASLVFGNLPYASWGVNDQLGNLEINNTILSTDTVSTFCLILASSKDVDCRNQTKNPAGFLSKNSVLPSMLSVGAEVRLDFSYYTNEQL